MPTHCIDCLRLGASESPTTTAVPGSIFAPAPPARPTATWPPPAAAAPPAVEPPVVVAPTAATQVVAPPVVQHAGYPPPAAAAVAQSPAPPSYAQTAGAPPAYTSGLPAFPTSPSGPPAYGVVPARRSPFAHFGRRILAYAIDWVVFVVASSIVISVSGAVLADPGSEPGNGLAFLGGLWLGLGILYWYLPTAMAGRTLGKLICGIRVVRVDDYASPPGLGGGAARCVVAGGMAIVPLGWLINLAVAASDDPERRAVHDRAARTRVVRADWSPLREGYPTLRPGTGTGMSRTLIVLLSILVSIFLIGILAAVAIPVFLNQRAKGVDAQMRTDATNAASSLMRAHGTLRFPMRIPEGAPATIGDTAFQPAPGDRIVITVARNGSGRFCVRVDNDSATSPVYLDSAAGTIGHTHCHYRGKVRIRK